MKKLSVFVLVLCLVCSCVWAFPGKAASSGNSSVESSETKETSEQLWEEVQKSANSYETEQNEMSEELSTLLADLQNSSRLTKSGLSELISKLEVLQEDIEAVNADSRAKDEQIKALASKAYGFHFYANAGAVLGFKNTFPTLGAVLNLGVKFGAGWTVGTGLQYQLMTFDEDGKHFDYHWNIDKLSITATVGFEW